MATYGGPHHTPAPAGPLDAPPGPPTGGFKLKLKLGGNLSSAPSVSPPVSSHSTPAPPALPAPPYGPAPSTSAAVPPRPPVRDWEMLPPRQTESKASAAPAVPQPVQEVSAREVEHHQATQKEAKGVSSAKYRELKRKYDGAIETRDSATLALHRTQKLVVRLREEKASLLDRVILLEAAAGLSSHPESPSSESTSLLHPSSLPSMADRPRERPVITTATDMSSASYNDYVDPPPPSSSLPPRARSKKLQTALAAEKLRTDVEAQRAAHGLPMPTFPAVAVLGLEGTSVATRIERLLSGEADVEDEEMPLASTSSATKSAGKRKRESSVKVKKAAGVQQEHNIQSLNAMPNPFAGGAGAVDQRAALDALPNPFAPAPPPPSIPAPEPVAAPTTEPIVHSPAVASSSSHVLPEVAYAASTSAHEPPPPPPQEQRMPSQPPYGSPSASHSAFSADGDADSNPDVKPTFPSSQQPRKHRKSDVPPGERMIKPKKLKTHGITSGTFLIPFVHRNEDGTPILPMPIGIMTLRNLGTIVLAEHFNTERYIFPDGFEASRKYPSMIDPATTVEYLCRIVDSGSGAPRFELHPADQPSVVISAGTPTGAWSQVVKAANKIRERNHSNSVSGPDYYGLAQNVVKALIQELPGAKDVEGYVWQTFVEEPNPASLAASGMGGPISAADEVRIAKKALPKKVVGAKRKRLEDGENGSQSPNPPNPYDLPPSNMSPQPDYAAAASLSHILAAAQMQQQMANDPYSLPPPTSNTSATYDPYSLPLPNQSIAGLGMTGTAQPPYAGGGGMYQQAYGYGAARQGSSDSD